MKKILGILALMLAVSGIASAEQDVLKDIKFSTEVRQGWQDRKGQKANGIGNAGFKKDNRARTRWRNTVSGELSLVDEWGLGASFKVMNDQDTNRNKFKNNKITHLGTYNKRENWYTTLELTKGLKIGALDTKMTFGWYNETYRRRLDKDGNESLTGQKKSEGIWSDIYFGPSFDFKLLGHDISTTLQLVYFNIKGSASGDYHLSGSDFVRGKAEGWGVNADFTTGKDIYNGNLGKVAYSIDMIHHFRDASGKINTTGKDAKSNVYVDYVLGLSYTTPSFAGFYGKVSVSNEWEKYTAVTGYNNYFSVWTDLGYKTSFDTNIGKITINPFVRYRPIHRESEYNKHNENKRKTIEINEFRAGLSVSLTAN